MSRIFSQTENLTSTSRLDELVALISARVEVGEPIDLAAFTVDCPQFRERLEMLLPTLEAVVELEHSFAHTSVVRGAPALAHPAISNSPPLHGEGLGEGSSAAGLLGDFRILREVGRGGMGVVYEAEQISLGRCVALKVLPFAAMLDRQQLARFKNEARAAATLKHPNIVSVYSVGCERGVHFFAMELIEGQSLAQVVEQLRAGITEQGAGSKQSAIRNSQFEFETDPAAHLLTLRAPTSSLPAYSSREYFRTIAQLGIQAAEALDHAHQNGILHRDIKPANLLVECSHLAPRDDEFNNMTRGSKLHHVEDRPWRTERDAHTHLKLWITDFGLARIEQDAGMTMTGDLLGTLRYMSPEQALAKRVVVDHRSDIYSLGVTLYELLTLQPAFTGDDRHELLRQIAFDEPRKPRQINARIPHDLETIILKAIEKNPVDRYSTAQELADDLRRFVAREPILAKPPSVLNRGVKWARRHVAIFYIASIALSIIALACLAASLLVYRAYRSEAKQRATAEANLLVASQSVYRALNRTADARYNHGDLTQAEVLAEDAIKFYEQLLRNNDTPELRYCAALAYGDVANIWNLLDQHEKQAAAAHRANELLQPLIAEAPDQAEYRLTRAWNDIRVGRAEFNRGRYSLAAQPFARALADIERLVERYPEQAKYKLDLTSALDYCAKVFEKSGRLDDAEACYARIDEIRKRLPQEFLNSPHALTNRAAQLANRAIVARKQSHIDRELQLLRLAITTQRRALEAEPNNPWAREQLCRQYINLTQCYLLAGRPHDAAETVETLIADCGDRLRACHEGANLLLQCAQLADETTFASWLSELAESFSGTAQAGTSTSGTSTQAEAYRKRARELVAMAHKAPLRTPDALDLFIQFLLKCDDKSFRDVPRAVELAKNAAREVPKRHAAWYSLAFAHYCNRDSEAAETALDTAIALAPGGIPNRRQLLLLSLICHQQGRIAEARQWHDKFAKSAADENPHFAKRDRGSVETDNLLETMSAEMTRATHSEHFSTTTKD